MYVVPGIEKIHFEKIELSQVISNPEKYNQKDIQIDGYAVFGFEVSSIYLNRHAASKDNSENALWIVPDCSITDKQSKDINEICNHKHIIIKGLLNTKEHGHLGFYKAEMRVKFIQLY